MSDKIDFKTKKVTRDKEGHYIMIKGSVQQEDVILTNIYIPNIGTPKYEQQTQTHAQTKSQGMEKHISGKQQ